MDIDKDINMDVDNDHDENEEIFKIETMEPGINAKTEEEMVKAIDAWCQKNFIPLTKVRRKAPGTNAKGDRVRGQRGYKCAHGVERQSKSKDEKRPFQRVKFTGCQAKVNVNEREDGTWTITTCNTEHVGHEVSAKNYLNQNKNIKPEEKDFIKEMVDVQANNKNIAEMLSNKTGKQFNSQDVRNIVSRIKESDEDKESIEELLTKIKEAGGSYKYRKMDGSNDVRVLFIQTSSMKRKLWKSKPLLFESDTTFGTQVEGYKTWCPVFFDQFTNKWEVAGIVLLLNETKENVEDGVKFFKETLTYSDAITKWIFFVDKDFDYINVLEQVFEHVTVLLCNVHTDRYFREKVFTSKAFWGKAEQTMYLGKTDKDDILALVRKVRDAPTEELYREREAELLDKTSELTVRPGQSTEPVKFTAYYNKNWKTCSSRWVRAFRKNLPTNGVNDTQAIESTFSAVKRFIRRKYPGRNPKLVELVAGLVTFFDQRSEEREEGIKGRSLRFQHKDIGIREAMKTASVYLNEGGFRKFVKEIQIADNKFEQMKLKETNSIEETYTGKATKGLKRVYHTDGLKCTCSWIKQQQICRHQIHFRKESGLPIFELKMFPNSLRKIDYQEEILDVEDISSSTVTNDPNSPGMADLIEEEQEHTNRMKPNVKYNVAYEATKPLVDHLIRVNQEDFLGQVETVKQFTELVRKGLPEEVAKVIEEHYHSASLSSSKGSSESQDMVSPSSLPSSNLKQVREEHKEDLLGWDLFFQAAGNGLCLDTCSAVSVYEDPGQAEHVRRMRHNHIVSNWWFYQPYFSLPYTETVGVGEGSHQVHINNYDDLKTFLSSDESLFVYANSQVDIASLANLYNCSVHTYTYNVQAWDIYGSRAMNRWTTTSPDPLLADMGPAISGEICDIVLYQEDDSHYDLLVRADSRLALQGTVPQRIGKLLHKQKFADVPLVCEGLNKSPPPPAARRASPATRRRLLMEAEGLSPLVFPSAPRGRGRPKTKNQRQGAPIAPRCLKRKAFSFVPDCLAQYEIQPAPKKRGRPKGSKNKQVGFVDEIPDIPLTQRTRAELGASPEEDSFIDSGDYCDICGFRFNDPIKAKKPITKCRVCLNNVHKPCIEKDGCTCQ